MTSKPQDEFRREYLGELARDEEYDEIYKLWREYFELTEHLGVGQGRAARAIYRRLLAPIEGHVDPEKFQRAKIAAGHDVEETER